MKNKYRVFNNMLADFKHLISTNNWPSSIRWVSEDGILFLNNSMLVRVKSAHKSEQEARKFFNKAVRDGQKLSVEVICCTPGTTWIHLTHHPDENTSNPLEYTLASKKSAVPGQQIETMFVTNPFSWMVMKWVAK